MRTEIDNVSDWEAGYEEGVTDGRSEPDTCDMFRASVRRTWDASKSRGDQLLHAALGVQSPATVTRCMMRRSA